ncbi:MAG: VCBS repeat-containing protein [Thermodesulfobacteriota bacterium]
MDSSSKKILIIYSAVAWVVIAASVYGGRHLYLTYVKPNMPEGMAKELVKPGVLKGEGLLAKRKVFKDSSIGYVTDITTGRPVGDRFPVGVAGAKGAVFLDEKWNVESFVDFKKCECPDQIEFVDVENDWVSEFMVRSSDKGFMLLNNNGDVLWTYAKDTGASDTATGDFDGDGRKDFAIAVYEEGIRILDGKGNEMWQIPVEDVWRVEAGDVDNDGKSEIVHYGWEGNITAINSAGEEVGSTASESEVSYFIVSRWPDIDGDLHMIGCDGSPLLQRGVGGDYGKASFLVMDFNGGERARLEAPQCNEFDGMKGAFVDFNGDGWKYFIVMTSSEEWDRSALYLYDPNGALVYHEILPYSMGEMTAVSVTGSGAEVILVGGDETVWQYELNGKPK